MTCKNKKLCEISASQIVKLVEKKRVTCREVIQAHINRIKAINPGVNAVTVLLEEQALEAADWEDKKIADSKKISALQGVPFTVKENIDVTGSATTLGTSAMENIEPLEDAPLVVQLKKAGAIPIARTNLSEWALRPHTENKLRGATLNPWNSTITPGGSSGGDAVAVATGMAPIGIGNDYGGSLRFPAQLNGITTIKPSLGRVPDYISTIQKEPSITAQLFLSQGPFARTIEDLRITLHNISKYDGRDPNWIPAKFFNRENCAQPVKIAAVYDPAGEGVEAEVHEGIVKAAKIFMDSGYIVEEVEPPSIKHAWDIFVKLTSLEKRIYILPKVSSFDSEKTAAFIKYWTNLFSGEAVNTYMDGLAERNRIAREWSFFMEKYPLIIGPASTMTAPYASFDVNDSKTVSTYMGACRFMITANLLGLPALVVPVGIKNGMPLAVQIIGPKYFEELCFDAAQCIEQEVGTLTPILP